MVIDTSAIIAILLDEPENETFSNLLSSETPLAISAVTLHEASIVVAAKKKQTSAARLVDELVLDLAIEVCAVTVDDAMAARDAYFRYGRNYHRAALNFGDCFAYALAKSRNEPLLFKGDDFSKTDVTAAWPR
jgi:ribonuclease VapC